jgi:WhiB family transcriptional regulator, redox-sensing transcriptional regulator
MMLFFGPDGERPPEREIRERKAKAICAVCPIRAECLEYALGHPARHGIWGGLNAEELAAERRRLLRRGAIRVGSFGPGAVDAAGRR